jgi:hypothetical protein
MGPEPGVDARPVAVVDDVGPRRDQLAEHSRQEYF